MKLVLFFSLSIIVLSTKAISSAKRSFELFPNSHIHTISECMHVASQPGDYIFKRSPQLYKANSGVGNREAIDEPAIMSADILATDDAMEVCGLYVIGEPDTIVEITMKHYDVNCKTGGLMAFVDGWELNGEYFPGLKDHHRLLEDRITEFCNNYKEWPRISNKKFFRSSQNSALLQYRIPIQGSFIANVRFHKISQPCNVLVHDTSAFYVMANYGHPRNCTISALFSAVISLSNLKVGGKIVRQQKVKYDCSMYDDRLEIGGSSGLDSSAMEKSSEVCGFANVSGPEQAIYCGVTSVRLISTGRYHNQATVAIRKAELNDLDIATLICSI